MRLNGWEERGVLSTRSKPHLTSRV